ncbi:MAG: ROK family protein [Rhodoglobus sp.]
MIGIGIDIGGTKIAAGVVTSTGEVVHSAFTATPAKSGSDAVLAAVATLVLGLLEIAESEVSWVGVGTAGAVDTSTGVIVDSTDAIFGWTGTPIAEELKVRLSLASTVPVTVRNDVDAHAIGESWLGAGASVTSLLMVAVGTGVGGAVVLDGVAVGGARHRAGDVGHIPVAEGVGMTCSCGRLGHLEAVGSGPGLYRLYLSLGGDSSVTDAVGVVDRARAEDLVAIRAVGISARAVGRAIAGASAIFDPALVIIGGGLGLSGAPWWPIMLNALRSELVDAANDLRVETGTLGAMAGVIGASRESQLLFESQLKG